MHKAFYNSYRYLKSHKRTGFLILFVYLLITGYFAWNIQLEEDITSLIPSGGEQENLKKVLRTTNLSDKLIISISAENENVSPDSLVSYAEALTGKLESNLDDYILDIKGKIPPNDLRQIYGFVYENLPIFLNEKDYNEISNRLYADSIRARIGSGYRQLMSPTGFVTKDYFLRDPLSLTNLGLSKLQELQVGENFGLYNNYLITNDRKNILLFVDAAYPSSETDKNEEFLQGLDSIVNDLNGRYPEVETSYFGGMMYSIANASRIKQDIRLSLGIAGSILLLLLIFFYRKIYVPLILFIPSIVSGITAIALLSLVKGSVSAISLGIGSILLGITLDYSLHTLTHYRNNRDVSKLYRDITKPVLMSSITTAVAFLCLVFLNSEALTDLGIFAAVSVIFSSILALLLVPLLYVPPSEDYKQNTFLDKIASVEYSRFRPLIYLILGIWLVSVFLFNNVSFNDDLSRINYQPEELMELERKVEGLAGREGKTIYMVAYGNNIDEALQENSRLYDRLNELEKEAEIRNFSSIGGVILSTATQNDRIENWTSFWNPKRADSLKTHLVNISGDYGFRPESFRRFYSLLEQDFENIDLDDYKDAGSLYLSDFISEDENIATVTSTVNLAEENTSEFLSEFEGVEGVLALDRKAMNQVFLGDLKDQFNKLVLFSLLAVFIILLIAYRSIEISLFTLLPILVTWICALGIMVLLDIEFNILNIIISSFIFGLGLDYSIFITNACLQEYETGKKELQTYQTSILISVITTMLGMGALIFAKHPALKSVSVVSIIGIISAVSISFILQRAIFRKLILERVENGESPYFLKQFIRSKAAKYPTESEKLYKKWAVLSNYRYKSIYGEVRKRFRASREKFLRVSRYLNEKDRVTVINSGYGILPLFLSYKFSEIEIHAFEGDLELLEIAKATPRSKITEIEFYPELGSLPPSEIFIIQGNVTNAQPLIEFMKPHARKVIIIDSEFPNRWLLDLNFEIVYRQNNILVLQKAE
ncbi:MMPL family transporter [Gramella sp. GC03-9]|uniref:MMPL family transporter n=1 Tax=Christiangramia oceanisediminis TaxID=2920386 RepID=A0A9X2KY43_9FLAO|nr:MMPL family transporter [Gramella oceanisediminis]MCP9200462.1 MMPL family transporter [Gramella oceanisediminis]